MEKYISFSVPIKKGHDNNKTITYTIKVIDTCRFMPSKLSDLVDNLSDINNKDCKTCMGRKNVKSKCEFIGVKSDRLHYKCKECERRCSKSKDGLIRKFPRMYQFCNGGLNKFVLLKMFIFMSIWIAGKDLMKHRYHPKNLFIAN